MNRIPTAILLITSILLGACASTRPLEADLPEEVFGDPQTLTYQAIRVAVQVPGEIRLRSDVSGRGAATKDGFKMMAAAPIGCMSGGIFAGVCYGLIPFFPLIAAARAEDPDLTRSRLEAFQAGVENYGIEDRLRDRVERAVESEQLPLLRDVPLGSESGVVTLNVALHFLDITHSGYKDGGTTISLAAAFELLDSSGQVLARRRSSGSVYFSSDSASTELAQDLDALLDNAVSGLVAELLLEWRPGVRLGPVSPAKVSRRNMLGFSYVDWTPVDSLTPTLAWQGLDELLSAEDREVITDLSYEIEIFGFVYRADSISRERTTIASARGLASPHYAVETPLLPCHRYYWSPRARFANAGVVRTVSAADMFVLLTPGEDCEEQEWTLPRQDEPETPAEAPSNNPPESI